MEVYNKAGFISGAASGLGRATAVKLSKSGAKLVLIDKNKVGLQTLMNELEGEHLALEVDVSDASSVAQAVESGIQKFKEIRFAISCAGIPSSALTVSKGIAHDLELWQRIIDINLTGTFNLMRHVAAHMCSLNADEDGQRGVIVNTSSIAAYDGQRGQLAYAASKAAIAGMCLPAARDLAPHGIRVMAIAPGMFDTELISNIPPTGIRAIEKNLLCPDRMGNPQEFASMVKFILLNSYVNGTVYRLDGGVRLCS